MATNYLYKFLKYFSYLFLCSRRFIFCSYHRWFSASAHQGLSNVICNVRDAGRTGFYVKILVI
jgi:hypothetical protein